MSQHRTNTFILYKKDGAMTTDICVRLWTVIHASIRYEVVS
jgi:hypothetical protein